jgi:hypothetical protein
MLPTCTGSLIVIVLASPSLQVSDSKESYRLGKKDYDTEGGRERERGQGPTKGCRAIDE